MDPGRHRSPGASATSRSTGSVTLVGLATSTSTPAERNPLPEGTLSVGTGLVISGICAYAFLWVIVKAVTNHDELSALQALWFATFALAPGFFLPSSKRSDGAVSHRLVLRQGGRPVINRASTLGAVLSPS
jgi:hypothetical protein